MSAWRMFWLTNYYAGVLKYIVRQVGKGIFGYSSWHRSPINWRLYAQNIIWNVESMMEAGIIGDGYVVEVGCGLGEIIGNIRCKKKIGIDIDEKVIRGAKFFHLDTKFLEGETKDIPVNNIDVLIMVDWWHGINPQDVHDMIAAVLPFVRFFIFDVFSDGEGKAFNSPKVFTHDGRYLLDNSFWMLGKSGDEATSTYGGHALKHTEYWASNGISTQWKPIEIR